MKLVQPKAFIIAETRINEEALQKALAEIQASEWKTGAPGDAERLIEFSGKMCYASLTLGVNQNLTKVGTRDNFEYLQESIIGSGHLSCIEHAHVTIFFANISRVMCFHPSTEILTLGGWKPVASLTSLDVLLTKDPVTGVDRWSPNKKLHTFEYDGWLLYSESSQWQSPKVTGDHLVWAKKHDVRSEPQYEKIPASLVHGLRYYQDHAINLEAVDCPSVVRVGAYTYPAKALYRWLGWVASDGHISESRNRCAVGQVKGTGNDDLEILYELLFKGRYKTYDIGMQLWCISCKDLKQWVLYKLGTRVKAERTFLGMLSDHPALLASFIEGMLAGDGTLAGGSVPVLYCRDEVTAKNLQVLVARVGLSSNVRVDTSRVGDSHNLNGVDCVNRLPAVSLHIHQSGESLTKRKHCKAERYSGKVYCPETEDGLVYARNKGRPVWSGNTHELVRHRIGSYSQSSGRYIRTNELSFWIPSIIRNNLELTSLFEQAVLHQEEILSKMEEASGIKNMTQPAQFSLKKKLTSAFRRISGNGIANHLVATFNHRMLRHMITLRTSRHAEEEIRIVFDELFEQLANKFPAIYADAERTMVDGCFETSFKTH